MRQTGPSFRGAFGAMKDFAPIAAFCSTALKTIDPLQHRLLWDVRERRMTNPDWPEQPIFKLYNPTLLWECCEVVYNRWSPPHYDREDPDMSWAAIVYFGTFDEAWFEFEQLALRVRQRPGDAIFLRARNLRHAVSDWGTGDRCFLIYFTHESAWKNVGMGGQCASHPVVIPEGAHLVTFKLED